MQLLPPSDNREARPVEQIAVLADSISGDALERAGYEVRRLGSQQAALQAANACSPECWVVDDVLPDGSSGLDLVKALREARHPAPVILMTDAADPDQFLHAMRSGVREFLRRGPGLTEFLVTRVRAVLDSVRTEQQLVRSLARAEAEGGRRRQLEAELDERRGAERMARNAIDRLEEVDRRKDAFLAMLGHELRNPLAPIANAIEVLKLHEAESPEVRWAVGVVGRQVTQLRRLVDDLLDVARITYGRFQLAFAPLLLGDVVRHAIERCRALIDARGHRLRVFVVPEPLAVYGDSTRLEQAVVNLIDNAAKYTPEGGELSIATSCEGGECVLRIDDNGIGIRAEDIQSIFQLFVQGERDMARSQGGLGVGLSLVRRVAEAHGGRVEAASPGPGQGSQFTLRLPLSQIRPPVDNDTPGRPSARPGARIVVVDDDPDCAESMVLLLRLWGFSVESAHDGESALLTIAATKPDAVLLDLGLPGIDGFGVAQRLCQLAPSRECMLVAVTGYGQHADRERTRLAGFRAHLVKPVAAKALRETLAPLLLT
jgi:signal transduction histidine kinase